MNRRDFMKVGAAGLFAPAYVKAGVLMPCKKIVVPPTHSGNRILTFEEMGARCAALLKEVIKDDYLLSVMEEKRVKDIEFKKGLAWDIIPPSTIKLRLPHATTRL